MPKTGTPLSATAVRNLKEHVNFCTFTNLSATKLSLILKNAMKPLQVNFLRAVNMDPKRPYALQ